MSGITRQWKSSSHGWPLADAIFLLFVSLPSSSSLDAIRSGSTSMSGYLPLWKALLLCKEIFAAQIEIATFNYQFQTPEMRLGDSGIIYFKCYSRVCKSDESTDRSH